MSEPRSLADARTALYRWGVGNAVLVVMLLACCTPGFAVPQQYDPQTAETAPAQQTSTPPPADELQTTAPPESEANVPAKAEQLQLPQLPQLLKQPKQLKPREAVKGRELTDFQLFVASSLGRVLPIYGASLFDNVPTTFAPVDRVPVTADYVIGPGDELLIQAWGQIDVDVDAAVDRNGAIYLPKVGSLNVAGLKYGQLQEFLRSHIGKIYQNFDLNVSMGELRSIDVYVVGQARRPGRYTVSALSTLTNAIFASGGPSTTGSMRRIQLKRGSKQIVEFDLYDLLINGDKSKDVLLQPEDVIYVSPVGPQVAMGGQVNVPAIYELKKETQLSEVIGYSGGLSTTAFGGKVLVEHIEDRQVRKVEEVLLDAAGLSHPLKDGDVVNITSVSPRFENSVTLRGNVATPGRYPWHANMRISDLIPNREFLITRDYWKQQNTIALRAGAGAPVSEAQNDVKRNAPDINWDYAVVQRISAEDLSTELIPFNLGKAILAHDEASNVVLQVGDIVTIFSQADLRVPEGKQTKLVRLDGEVTAGGVYRAKQGQGLRDLLVQAGGLAPSAYLYAAEFTRESVRLEQQERLDMMIAQTEREVAHQAANMAQNARTADQATAAKNALEAQQASLDKLRKLKADGRIVLNIYPKDQGVEALPDLPLEDGDRLYVPPRPIVVNVIGEVYNQGSFIQQPGKTVSNYLRAAGGPNRDADKGRIFVVRANGAVVSKDASSKFWAGGFDSMVLMPGDTVVVPEQIDKGSTLRAFKDWSQILFNFGLAAAAVNVLK